MFEQKLTNNSAVTDDGDDTEIQAKDDNRRQRPSAEHRTVARSLQTTVDPGSSGGCNGIDDASPLGIRTDLNFDPGPADSPFIAIPLQCSVEIDKESNCGDVDAMLTPCPYAESPERTLTELAPVRHEKPFQAFPLDYSGTRNSTIRTTDGFSPTTTTGSVSITDIVASGNVISIATAEPMFITDVIATGNRITIATAEPIFTDNFSSSLNHSFSHQLSNSIDMNANDPLKQTPVHTPRIQFENRPSDVRNVVDENRNNIVKEKRHESISKRVPLPNSAEAIYGSRSKQQASNAGDEARKTEDRPMKRKRNRSKPDPNEPPLAPPVTVLPPCAICGSKSSGFHYGANTCEACKGFFRRTLKKNEVKFQCCCTDEEKQERRRDGGVGKNTCPACRYEQCLAVGMSRNAIKIGRYSLERKTNNICFVKTMEENEETSNGQSSPTSFSGMNTSPTSNVSLLFSNATSPSGNSTTGSVSSLPNSPNDAETTSPIGISKHAPPAKKIKLSGEVTLPEIDTYVKTLYHAFKCLLEETPVVQKEKLRLDQKNYLEQYKLKQEMFGLRKPITKEEYFELYNTTGLELDNRKEHVMEAVKYFEEKISKLVEFAKCIPGFRDLTLQDQANLIKASRIDCNFLSGHSLPLTNIDDNITTMPWGKHMHLDEVVIVDKEFILGKYRIKKMVESVDLTLEEEAMVAGILLTFTASRIDCGLLCCHSNVFLSPDYEVTTTPWGKHIHLDEVDNIANKEFILDKYRIKEKLKDIDLTVEEEAVLAGLTLTFSDRCELNEPEKVQTIQHKLLACLQYLIEIRPNSIPNKLGRIFNFLIAVRNISEWEAEIIKQVSLDFPTVANLEKFEYSVFKNLNETYRLERR